MTTTKKIVAVVAGCLVLLALAFLAGYFTHSYRQSAQIAEYTKREQENQAKLRTIEAQQNQLRGVNDQLRQHVAQLSAQDELLTAQAESRGGAIAAEAKNLETINEELKKDLAGTSDATNPCAWCREFSARALARGQIAKPLACKDECAGSGR